MLFSWIAMLVSQLSQPSQPGVREYTQLPFFTFTMQGMLQLAAIVTIGWQVIKFLRRFNMAYGVWAWQHEVMWQHHRKHHKLPDFPYFFEDRRKDADRRKIPYGDNDNEENGVSG